MDPNDVVVDPSALDEGVEIGIGGDVEKRLRRMAVRAAPFTHPRGNRRFYEFVLRVDNRHVRGVTRLETA
jgi:hypothetical protein